MTWMLTAHGTAFNLRCIAAEQVRIEDIAHHLAQINRYTGACSRPYSVAEHSLLVVEILERDLGARSPLLLMAGLLHDAHEAYTNDLSRPMKDVIGEAWRMEERRIETAVLARFGLAHYMAAHKETVRRADNIALVTERAQLLPPTGPAWHQATSHQPATWWRATESAAFTWEDWRQAFLDRFAALDFAIHGEPELQPRQPHATAGA